MNITHEQADYLLHLPKKIVRKNKILPQLTINQTFPFRERFELISETDNEFSFLWEIQQSPKKTIRVSLHFQENDSKTGLLRVDFNAGHVNPASINEYVPDKFFPYIGKTFLNHEHHIHYYVQGYGFLAWAIPLSDDDFGIKEIGNENFNATFANIITLFAQTINLKTLIRINTLLL
jgi:hypothetical protein